MFSSAPWKTWYLLPLLLSLRQSQWLETARHWTEIPRQGLTGFTLWHPCLGPAYCSRYDRPALAASPSHLPQHEFQVASHSHPFHCKVPRPFQVALSLLSPFPFPLSVLPLLQDQPSTRALDPSLSFLNLPAFHAASAAPDSAAHQLDTLLHGDLAAASFCCGSISLCG